MAQEIERKFLVQGEFKSSAYASERIVQGYLSSVPERTVRVRALGDKGFLTIKGVADKEGVSRYEWEKEIPVSEALELMKLCEPGIIDKVRYFIKCGTHIFEVDEFQGENAGLIMAEVELRFAAEDFERPGWLGEEVTGDKRYYNAMLSKYPYAKW